MWSTTLITDQSKLTKNWLECVSTWPTSITNSVFLLAIIATPIDLAHCRPCAFLYKTIFQKVLFCVLTHLIGQNGGAVCKSMYGRYGGHGDAFNVMREVQSTRSRPLSVSLLCQYQCSNEATCHCTRKLGHQASHKVRGSVTVLCHTCLEKLPYYSIEIRVE